MNFGDFFWLLIWSFFFVFYLMILFQILGDLFRDKDLSGWWKAVWVIALIVFPFLTALIYLIARGREWPSGRQVRCEKRKRQPTLTFSRSQVRATRQTRSPLPKACSTPGPSPRQSSTRSRHQPSPDTSPPFTSPPVRPHGGPNLLTETQLATSTNGVGPTANR